MTPKGSHANNQDLHACYLSDAWSSCRQMMGVLAYGFLVSWEWQYWGEGSLANLVSVIFIVLCSPLLLCNELHL